MKKNETNTTKNLSATGVYHDTMVVDHNLRTPEGLTVPLIFENCRYISKDGLTIPAFFVDDASLTEDDQINPADIVSEAEEATQGLAECSQESNQGIDRPEDETVDIGIIDFSHHHPEPRAIPSARQNSLSLCDKINPARTVCPANDVSFSMLSFSTDDIGNADRFLSKYGDVLRYNYDIKSFLLWDGSHWKVQDEKLVKNMCEKVMKTYRHAASYFKNSRNFDESDLYVHSCISCNNGKLNALVEILKERFAVPNEIFDTYGHLLTVRNGVVDLRTGELFPHQKELFLTGYCDVDFSPAILSYDSVFATFLSSICCGNAELMNFLQLCFGYAITGETREQKLFLLYGTGSNGKSTLIEAIDGVISSYAKHIPVEILTGLSDNRSGAKPSPELAQALRTRAFFTSEPNEGTCLNEGIVKLLTGGGKINVRQLYGAPFEFEPKFKIFLDTNHLPSISGEQFAIQRRLCVIPFNATFKGTTVDRFLPEKLKSPHEKEVILAWLIKGAVRYYREGLNVPPSIASVTAEYVQENDSLSRFFSECVRIQEGATCYASALFATYSSFCTENGIKPATQTAFGRTLVSRGIEKGRNSLGIYYKNIQII